MGKFFEWYFGEKSMKRGKLRGESRNNDNLNHTPPGCMSAVFQFFDFQNFHVCFDQSVVVDVADDDDKSFVKHENPKGVEAPIKSLETEEIPIGESSDETSLSPIIRKDDTSLIIPMDIKINTKIEGPTSENSYSPSTKSPNLVARLMGLDLLPLDPLASLSPSNHKANPLRSLSSHNRMSRSLPETPRTSSERKSDVDHHHDSHRFSLQIIREKVIENDENMVPNSSHYYAKQIVKQVKENVGKRRVGSDITNRVLKNIAQERRDENLIGSIKSKKSSKNCIKVVENHDSTLHSSYPSRPKNLELKGKSMKSSSIAASSSNEASLSQPQSKKPKQVTFDDQQRHQQVKRQVHCEKSDKEIRQVPKERFRSRLGKAEKSVEKPCNDRSNEFFVGTSLSSRTKCLDKKWKKIPLLNDALPQKQVATVRASKYGSQISINSIQKFKQEATPIFCALSSEDSTPGDRRLEYQYITNVLRFVGIDKDTRVSFPTWHPLDPSIFNYIDLVFSTFITSDVKNQLNQLSLRCNRRLVFNLVDEIISSILQPPQNIQASRVCSQETARRGTDVINGSVLVEELCAKIRSYPNAKCEDLHDIDALVGHDLGQSTFKLEEEDEEGSIVMDIEKDIVESLVEEIVVLMLS